MKRSLMAPLLLILLVIAACARGSVLAAESYSTVQSLYQLSAESLEGEHVELSNFSGKVALVVNTASRCGFTSQYEGLEKIYKEYSSRGFVVLGFPSNDFGDQEPGDNQQIREFCTSNFGVSFPMFSRGPVTGPDKQTVFAFLTEMSNEEYRGEIGWNFVKFLVDREGRVVDRFSSITSPDGSRVRGRIEDLLNVESPVPTNKP